VLPVRMDRGPTAERPVLPRVSSPFVKIWNTARSAGTHPVWALQAGDDLVAARTDGIGTAGRAMRRAAVALRILSPVVGKERRSSRRIYPRHRSADRRRGYGSTAFRQISLTPFGRSARLVIGTLSPGDGCVHDHHHGGTEGPISNWRLRAWTANGLLDRIE